MLYLFNQKQFLLQAILTIFFSLTFASFSFVLATNAGVLPYAKKDGKILVCLGYGQSKVEKKMKWLWSDFGGTADSGETTEDTAAREAHEESIGKFFKPELDDTLADGINYQGGIRFFKNKLNDAYKIERTWQNATTTKMESYTLFLVEVPYVSPEEFQETRLAVQTRSIKHDYLDKSSIGWVDVNELQQATEGKTYKTSQNVAVQNVSTKKNITLYHQLVLGLTTQKGQIILKALGDKSGNSLFHHLVTLTSKELETHIANDLLKPTFNEEFDKKIKAYLEVATTLKNAGADASIKNNENKTPADLIADKIREHKLSSDQIPGSANAKLKTFFLNLEKIFGISTEVKDDFVKEKLTTLRQKLKDLKEKLYVLSKRLTILKAKLV